MPSVMRTTHAVAPSSKKKKKKRKKENSFAMQSNIQSPYMLSSAPLSMRLL